MDNPGVDPGFLERGGGGVCNLWKRAGTAGAQPPIVSAEAAKLWAGVWAVWVSPRKNLKFKY
jgi:hypothetical protein